MSEKYSYDEECERLARHFLNDEFTPDETRAFVRASRDLAQSIQECVEDWINSADLVLYIRTPHTDGC